MAQQAPFIKLKEQIEAAKRDLSAMSDTEIANSPKNLPGADPSHGFSLAASPKIVEPEKTKANFGDVSCSDTASAKVVDMSPKTVPSDSLISHHASGKAAGGWGGDFQFFYRAKQPYGNDGLRVGVSPEEVGSADVEVLPFERLGGRLADLEGGVEQNRKYILELINLLSQLDLRQEPAKRKIIPLQSLNRRYAFWVVIGFLAVGWFCLTPSGHVAVRYFLAFI